ncbi:MAG: hypothetical protein COV80_04210, partial [Parcubacteria group bacterium CG11_big_fil_rev_8_21_14_0_20_48_46]
MPTYRLSTQYSKKTNATSRVNIKLANRLAVFGLAAFLVLPFFVFAPIPTHAGMFGDFLKDWRGFIGFVTDKSMELFSREPEVTVIKNTNPATSPTATTKQQKAPSLLPKNNIIATQASVTDRAQPPVTIGTTSANQGTIARLEALEVQFDALLNPTRTNTHVSPTSPVVASPAPFVPSRDLKDILETLPQSSQDIMDVTLAQITQSHNQLNQQLQNHYVQLQAYINNQISQNNNVRAYTVIGPSNSIPTLDAVVDAGSTTARNVTFSGTATFSGTTNVMGATTFSGNAVFDTDTLSIDSLNNRVGVGTTTPADIFSLNGPAYIAQISAPSNTQNRLYNTGGNLYWAGNLVGGGSVG